MSTVAPSHDQLHLLTIEALNKAVNEYKADVESAARVACHGHGASVVSDGDIKKAVEQIRFKKKKPLLLNGFSYVLELIGLAVLTFGLQMALGVDIAASDEARKAIAAASSIVATLTLHSSHEATIFGVLAMIVGALCAGAGIIIRET